MRIALPFLILLTGSVMPSFAQQPVTPSEPVTLEQKFKMQFETDRTLAQKIAAERKIQLRREDRNGRLMEFSRFDARGNMLFNMTDNVGAGRTISTNKVWPGGIVGTSLTGLVSGNRLGEWDGGGVLLTHQELTGRVTQVDAAPQVHYHAVHVAGTLIGAGVSANAKGMSYQANLRAYDWNSDASEMSTAAGQGMLLSNHSYGTITGWYRDGSKNIWWGDPSISDKEDYKFGFYDQTSANWDQIAFTNPNYLICKSAGNDRGDKTSDTTNWEYSDGSPGAGSAPPADGQYDCISTYSGAKNILTVGAVNKIGNSNTNNGWTKVSDVVMSSFSGWGPMDDGRIKPDVVGCGVNLYSSMADSNKAYSSLSGTSMATPNVCGSLLLVQQHFNNLKGKFMKSATLKGLTIHTADEAGNNGPDYQFGWGLVNIAKAVQYITDSTSNQIQERTLNNLGTYTQTISSSGGSPMRITICWTDPAGTPVSPSLDPPNKMLVNDLDIKLTRISDNAVFYPYILNKDTPSAVAKTGVNSIDNVEQIYLASPVAGNYTLTVSHKGVLLSNQPQAYSLIISGLMGQPSASIQSSARSICTGQTVTYTDMSSGSPTGRNWYFPGGTPSTSTLATVNVTYNTAGKFPVSLAVSNTLGKDSVYLVNYITAGGMTLPFNETFEGNSPSLTSWSIENTNNDTTWRTAVVGGTTPGNTAYCLPFYNYSTTGRRDGLITPSLNFKGYSSVSLSFAHAYTRDASASVSDSLIIWVSTNCGSTWSRLLARAENGTDNFRTVPDMTSEFIPSVAADWCSGPNSNCITLGLNAYAGMNNIKIKFEGYNRYSNNLFIDNVNITGTAMMPVANFYASKKTICAGEPVNFFDSTVNIATSWKWTFTGATTTASTVQNPAGIVYNTPGTYTVKLVSTNATGSDSITKTNYITVLANPGKPVISNTRALTFCAGDSTVLNSDSVASSYQWIVNGSPISGANAQQLVVYTSGRYRVKTTNAGGCSNHSDSVTVVANAIPDKPTISSSLTGGFMCTGGTAMLTSSAVSGNQWFKNSSPISGATAKTFNTSDSGSYTVQVTLSGCSGTASDPSTIALLPAPVTSAITGPDSSITGQTENYSVTNNVGSAYTWTITGGSKTAGGTTNSIQVLWSAGGAGSVSVQETGNNGCKGTTQTLNVNVRNNVGLSESGILSLVSLFPNPASGEVMLTYQSLVNKQGSIKVLNVVGQTVKQIEVSTHTGTNQQVIQLDQLERGIYFVELTCGESKMTSRLIVQ